MRRAAKGRRGWAGVLGLAALLLAAALPSPATASAPTLVDLETRVWASSLEIAAGIGVEQGLSSTAIEACGARCDEIAVGSCLVPRAGPDWRVAPHGQMPSPRPPGYQSHHGVNSVWAEANVEGYVANDAPAILMRNNPHHNATRGVFNRVRAEIARRQGVSPRNIDWNEVSPGTAWRIAEEQLEAARVPQAVQEDYFRTFNTYLDSLK